MQRLLTHVVTFVLLAALAAATPRPARAEDPLDAPPAGAEADAALPDDSVPEPPPVEEPAEEPALSELPPAEPTDMDLALEEPDQPPVESGADPFPFPEGLRGHVDFWTNVFGVWSNKQVAIHDLKYPGLVYEVIDLPGAAGGTYSPEQQRFVRAHREAIEERLRRLEIMVNMGAPLTDDEKALALVVATAAGNNALVGAADRVRSQRGIREHFRRGLQISGRYDEAFRKIFRESGLPEDLACLPHVESSFQAAARSSAGAVGIWQFTRGAAKIFMTLDAAIDERLDPVAAARGAARYLGTAYARLGDWALAITSYNHGMEGMANARIQFGNDFDRIVREYDGRLFGFASKNFYAEFLAARRIAQAPETWFPEGIAYHAPLAVDEVVLQAGSSAQKVAQRYGVSIATLSALNPGWTKRALRGAKPLPAGVSVWLPYGTLDRIAAARAPKPKKAEPPAAGSAPTSNALADFIVHVVRKGETLFDIATRHGVRLTDLLAANEIDKSAVIHPGQQLRVPALR